LGVYNLANGVPNTIAPDSFISPMEIINAGWLNMLISDEEGLSVEGES
jgi:hypothetical protein